MRRFYLLPLLLLLFSGCNQSGIGIFFSISREQPLQDTTLPNTLSVSGMVEGTTQYFVSAGGLYSRDIAGGDNAPWNDAVTMPSSEFSLCVKLVRFNGRMYGLFTNSAGTATKIFSSGLGAVNWLEAAIFDKPIVSLAVTASEMFVTVRNDLAEYVTWRGEISGDGVAFNTSLSLAGQYTGVTDAATLGADTYLISGTRLYSGNGITYAVVTGTGAPSSTSGFGGVYASTTLNRVFVSNHEGQVFSSADGTNWDSASVTDAAGNPVVLFDMLEVPVLTADVIVVGAENGYYDIVFASGYTSSFSLQVPGSTEAGQYSSSDANFLNIDLRTSVVRFFFLDTSSNTLFACTSGNGLWINKISGTSVATLTRKWDRQ